MGPLLNGLLAQEVAKLYGELSASFLVLYFRFVSRYSHPNLTRFPARDAIKSSPL